MKKSLTSKPELFSDYAWELLLESENEARRWRHEYLDVEHLLQVLFTDQNYRRFIDPLPINHSIILDSLEGFLANLPITNVENLFIGEDLEELLDTAENFRSSWGSRLIEISHILIAVGRDKRIGKELFSEVGLPSELLESELRRVPKTNNFRKKKNEEKKSTYQPIPDSSNSVGKALVKRVNERTRIKNESKEAQVNIPFKM